MQNIDSIFSSSFDKNKLLLDEPMKNHTSFKVGGPAIVILLPENADDIKTAITICKDNNIPYFIMGNGSNLLVKDSGYDGVIIKIFNNMNKIEIIDNLLYAEAGCLLSAVANAALKASLTGLEFAHGIPGTIGGAVFMNAGAYGGEIKDVLLSATVLCEDGKIINYNNSDLNFKYRNSIIQVNNSIVLSAEFALKAGEYNSIKNIILDLKNRRIEKQPLELPSAGSTFKRPEGHFAAKLISDAGLQGRSLGGAQVSEKHCGFIVNIGDATFEDIYGLIKIVQNEVYNKFSVMLEPEVRIL